MNMANQLSTYWVTFFTSAGFPLDVATKHAVVFSNNRIKPDMLPDLDKPSLKEMGITLMGDMIAILRYAKKVSEEMTCEKFLVDSKDLSPPSTMSRAPRTLIKKPSVISKVSAVTKSFPAKPGVKEPPKIKSVPKTNPPVSTGILQKKRVLEASTRAEITKKRKVIAKVVEIDSDSEEEWAVQMQKRLKGDVTPGYKVVLPRTPAKPSETISKNFEKRTVFDRLGDSSVTSTTSTTSSTNNINNKPSNASSPSLSPGDSSTTFNITGLGDVLKRNTTVFSRLGDKDKEERPTGILKNGGSNGQLQGILKSRVSNLKGTTVKLKTSSARTATGTMHADHEGSKKSVSTSVKQLVKTTKSLKLNGPVRKVERKINFKSKLASERSSVPAKARLGGTGQKQVTFNKVTTVKHIKKPGVFSRLGV